MINLKYKYFLNSKIKENRYIIIFLFFITISKDYHAGEYLSFQIYNIFAEVSNSTKSDLHV